MEARWLVLGSKRAAILPGWSVTDCARLRLRSSALGSVTVCTRRGVKGIDAALRPVGDAHVVAGQNAMVLRRQVGLKLQVAAAFGDHLLDFAPARPHLHLQVVAREHVRLGQFAAGHRQRPRGHHAPASRGHTR